MSRPWALALLAGALCLSACGPRKATFHGIDITGAGFGRHFELADPQGRQRSLTDFKGKVVLLFFGFTQCPDVCPTSLSRSADVLRLLGDDGRKVQVIFVTVDPERDTPGLLQAYTTAFHPTFLGLRGDLAQTDATTAEFKAAYIRVPTSSSYTMDHTTLTYAFDRQGRPRLALRHAQSAREVANDVSALLNE